MLERYEPKCLASEITSVSAEILPFIQQNMEEYAREPWWVKVIN